MNTNRDHILKNSRDRISAIKQTPLTWKELDTLTAAEKYLASELELPIIEFILPYFPNAGQKISKKLEQTWQFSIASFQLQKSMKLLKSKEPELLLTKASRIYEQETQRILGSIFPIEHLFWKYFYQRQETDLLKPLVSIDALYFSVKKHGTIPYQLFTQSLKAILQAQYEEKSTKILYYQKAEKLIVEMPFKALKEWITIQKKSIRN